jgi:hypothetical protein
MRQNMAFEDLVDNALPALPVPQQMQHCLALQFLAD